MRILLVLAFAFVSVLSAQAVNDLDYYRLNFHAIKGEKDVLTLINAPVQEEDEESRVIINAYKGACNAMMAKHVFFPLTKLNYFSEGKAMLEAALAQVTNAETVYLRLLIQLNAPRFLNYHDNIESDLSLFKANIATANLSLGYKRKFIGALSQIDNDEYDLKSLKNIKLE